MNKTAREIELEKKVAAGLRCEKIHLNRAFRAEKKMEIAVKAIDKVLNDDFIMEHADRGLLRYLLAIRASIKGD